MFCIGKNIGVGIIYNRVKVIYLNGLDNLFILYSNYCLGWRKFSSLCIVFVVYLDSIYFCWIKVKFLIKIKLNCEVKFFFKYVV